MIDGGAAILAQIRRNHHNEINGSMLHNPLVRAMLRVFVNSYVIFAMQNNPEETNPWAIIMANAPINPIFVLDKTPAIIRPICPTEE